jgi:polyhydroxyalkanoate synthesis regulator phasin
MARRSPPETLRGAVDRTVQATVGQAQMTRERAQELVDELAGTAGRVREALDDLRLVATPDDVRGLQARIEALEKRVRELERDRGSSGARQGGSAGVRSSAKGRGSAGARSSGAKDRGKG